MDLKLQAANIANEIVRIMGDSKIDFEISIVPYPRSDDDPELKNYQILIPYQEMYAVRNVKDNETGLTSSILFNILDDISNGLKPEATAVPSFEPVKSMKEYSSYLEARFSSLIKYSFPSSEKAPYSL